MRFLLLIPAFLLLASWVLIGLNQSSAAPNTPRQNKKVTHEMRKAAAARAAALRAATAQKQKNAPAKPSKKQGAAAGAAKASGAAMAMPMPTPGASPHYFGPEPNWAYSPAPRGSIASIALDSGGAGYTAPTVMITDAHGTGAGATATATASPQGVITNITLTNAGTNPYTAPIVMVMDPTGIGATATATIGGPLTGGIRKFVDTLPGLTAARQNNLGQYIPIATPEGGHGSRLL